MNAFSFFVQGQKFHGISVIWFFINLFVRWIYVLYFYESDNFKIEGIEGDVKKEVKKNMLK